MTEKNQEDAPNAQTETSNPPSPRHERSSNPGLIADLKSSRTDGSIEATEAHQIDMAQPEQPILRSQTNSSLRQGRSRRAWNQRSASDRPKPSKQHSILRKIPTAAHPERPYELERTATLTFGRTSTDSESTDSESSTDEDQPLPKQSLSHNETITRQETENAASRQETSGPFPRFKIANSHFKTRGKVSKSDGRLKLSFLEKDHNSGYIAKALGAVVGKTERVDRKDYKGDPGVEKTAPEDDEMEHDPSRRVKLNIVIIVIGSRGDIQPFVRIAKILKEEYHHRVRLATHPAFKEVIEQQAGLEFFSVGGNPAELMAFMVKNPGLIPNLSTIKEGEIGRRRAQMYEMFTGMWRACINASDDETDEANAKMSKEPGESAYEQLLTRAVGEKEPFVADAIIANPPSFAAPHIAEKLGVPLHMMFTYVLHGNFCALPDMY